MAPALGVRVAVPNTLVEELARGMEALGGAKRIPTFTSNRATTARGVRARVGLQPAHRHAAHATCGT